MSKAILNEDGSLKDISDEGEQIRELEGNVDLHFALKKLKPRYRDIIIKRLAGCTYREIGASSKTISKANRALNSIINIRGDK